MAIARITATSTALALVLAPVTALGQAAPHIVIPDAGKVLAPPSPPRDLAPQSTATGPLTLPDTAANAAHLRFSAVRIVGATVINAGEIAALFDPLRGKDATAAQLRAVLDQVNALYLARGYPLGRAYIPAQVMQGETLIVRVVEGHVGTVIVEADSEKTKAVVQAIAAHLTGEAPLTSKTLQRYMLLIQDIPGITVASRFTAMDPETGFATLTIAATIKPVTATFYLDNRTRLSGLPFTPYLIGQFNDVLGLGDQETAMALLSPRQKDYAFYTVGLSAPVGSDGLALGATASWAQALDTQTLAPYDVRTQTSQLGLTTRYPVIRSTDETLNADAKLYHTHAAYGVLGIALARDNYQAVQLGGDYVRAFSSTLGLGGNLHLVQGLGASGKGPATRANVRDDFTKLQGEARLVYQPLEHVSLIWRATAQYASASLFASEQISFGGLQYGRGFNSAEISGDSGLGFSFQPEYTIPFDLSTDGLAKGWSVTPYLFTDYAKAYNRPGNGLPDGELVSAGAGFRLGVSSLMTLTLEADKPLNRTPLYQKTSAARFYVGFELGVDQGLSLIAGNP
jgi:hemolysin activation/secretion protein